MAFLQMYGKEIVALIVPFITWALTFFKARARLQLSSPHGFTFLVQEPLRNAEGQVIRQTQTVNTKSFMLINAGRETATHVEWLFNWKPLCLNIWPLRHYEVRNQPDGRYALLFENLAPKEVLGCEIMSINADLPALLTVRSFQCQAANVEMYPQPIVAPWILRLRALLLMAGIGLFVYGFLVLIQVLVLKTPIAGVWAP